MGNWPPTVTCRNVPGGFFYMIAGVVKLVDAADSKSAGAWLHAGSIPALGTESRRIHLAASLFWFHLY